MNHVNWLLAIIFSRSIRRFLYSESTVFHLLLHLFDPLVSPLVVRTRKYLSMRLWGLLTILIMLVLVSLIRLLLFITFLNLINLSPISILLEDISVATSMIFFYTPHWKIRVYGRWLLGGARTLLGDFFAFKCLVIKFLVSSL